MKGLGLVTRGDLDQKITRKSTSTNIKTQNTDIVVDHQSTEEDLDLEKEINVKELIVIDNIENHPRRSLLQKKIRYLCHLYLFRCQCHLFLTNTGEKGSVPDPLQIIIVRIKTTMRANSGIHFHGCQGSTIHLMFHLQPQPTQKK